jgi:SEC-C motif-containing protein
MSEICPCGSGVAYEKCCGPYLAGTISPLTAEALMRSRYTAYVRHDIDYIVDTCVKNDEEGIDIDATRKWSQESEWLGLKIVKTEKGGATDSEGIVEFVASYKQKGKKEDHHEKALFVKKAGTWFYDTGKLVVDTVVREAPKVGRNEPCPCGSGKKYKQCHGK